VPGIHTLRLILFYRCVSIDASEYPEMLVRLRQVTGDNNYGDGDNGSGSSNSNIRGCIDAGASTAAEQFTCM